jgi:transcriptional regulator with XRE-family HTH domain
MPSKLTVVQARRLAGLTQEAAARRASISLSAFTKIEMSRRHARPATQRQIAQALGLSPAEIQWEPEAAVGERPSSSSSHSLPLTHAALRPGQVVTK